MVGNGIKRMLVDNEDASSKEARHRLRICCLLVLYYVRMERQTGGDPPSWLTEAELELDCVSHHVQSRIEELVKAARQKLVGRTTSLDRRLGVLFSSQSSALLSRLCTDDFRATAESLLNDYVELREWFFEGTAFKEWQNDGPWYMYCYGEPRCGKSSFAAAVARTLETQYFGDSRTAVISLFLGHGDDKERYATSHGVLGAILKQLTERRLERDGQPTVLHELSSNDLKALPYSPDLLQRCILKEMASLERVFLVVDGLDTYSADEASYPLEDELVRLRSLSATSPCALRLMLVQARTDSFGPKENQYVWCDVLDPSGTPCGEICEDPYWTCEQCEGGFFICHSCFTDHRHCSDLSHDLKVNVEIQSGISTYIDAKLNSISTETHIGRRISDAMAISKHIRNDIDKKAGGVLVVAKLYMDSLIEQQSIEEVLDILDRLPVYQRLYYNSLMFEIMSQTNEDRILALSALALVAASCNDNGVAMKFDEVKEAISHLTNRDDLVFTESHFLKCTKGLLAIPDVVTTFHDSASIYLAEECAEILAHHQVNLGSLCIKAIRNSLETFPVGRTPSPEALISYLKNNSFVVYASRHWGTNLRLASTDEAKETCLTFLCKDYDQQPCLRQMMFLATNNSRNSEMWTGGSQLHVVVWFGLVDTLQQMRHWKGQTLDPNAQDSSGRTPLHVACVSADADIAFILLEMGADPSLKDCEGRTAYWEAIERGDMATLHLLLHNPFQIEMPRKALNAKNSFFGGQTLLMLAIQKNEQDSNRDGMVEMLLKQHDIDLNVRDSAGRTALHVAASVGYYNGLELLTETSKYRCVATVDLDARDNVGRTAAITALMAGHKDDDGLVKVLAFLKRPQNSAVVDAVDNNGRSLLHCAATDEDNKPIIEYLKEAKADVNKQDLHGRTPLHIAAENLEAAEEHGVVHLLLGMKADLLAKDEQDLTPYDLASQRNVSWADVLRADGHVTQSERHIISWSDAVNNPDEYFENVADLPSYLMRQADPLCYTLLHCAVEANQVAAVGILLKNPHLDVNAQTQIYNTALHLALANMDIVELLLARDDIDVNLLDYQGQSALERAFDQEDDDHKLALAIALIKRGAHLVLPRKTKQEILNYAISHEETLDGDLEVVHVLLNGGASLFQYCRPSMLPSETAREDGASDKMIELLRKLERRVIELVAE